MIAYLVYRKSLWLFPRHRKKIRSAFDKEILLARKEGKSPDDIRGIEHSAWYEQAVLNEEISILMTAYLLANARTHIVVVPDRDEDGMWEQCSQISTKFVLTDAGISKLRSALRAEKKERMDLYIPWLAPITGILGVLVGIVSVFNK